jgi:hypothetical protein
MTRSLQLLFSIFFPLQYFPKAINETDRQTEWNKVIGVHQNPLDKQVGPMSPMASSSSRSYYR